MTQLSALEFNPMSLAFISDPHPVCRQLREETPLFYWETAHCWVATRHAECSSLSHDPRFSLDYMDWEFAPPRLPEAQESDYERVMKHGLFRVEARAHSRLRRLASPLFSSRSIERIRPDIQRIVDEAIAQSARGGAMDGCSFAEFIPIRVMAGLLGIPIEAHELFHRFSEAVLVATNPATAQDRYPWALQTFAEGAAMLRAVLEERRRRPVPGELLSDLVSAEDLGDRLSTEEILALAAALVVAGTETTVQLISSAILNLLRHPAALAEVRADASLLRNALDEVLRYDYLGGLGAPRYAREEVELAGIPIRTGQMVIPLVVSALRDPAVFPHPDLFDIRRELRPSLAFGAGPHSCIGAVLGRLEGQLAISTLLRRFPDLALSGKPSYRFSSMTRPLATLPLLLGAPAG